MYNNRFTLMEIAPDGELNDLPSLTVEGESYTIKELLRKHVRGMMPAGQDRSPQYSEDSEDFNQPDLNQLSQLDITDKDTLIRKTKTHQTSLIDEIKQQETLKNQELEQKAESIAKSKQAQNDKNESGSVDTKGINEK